MEIHHGRHYKAYVDNYNKALEGHGELLAKPVEQVIANNLESVRAAFAAACIAAHENPGIASAPIHHESYQIH